MKRLLLFFMVLFGFSSVNAMMIGSRHILSMMKKAQEKKECQVCFDEKAQLSFVRLHCGHDVVCRECLNNLVDVALRSRDDVALKCPSCGEIFTEADIAMITGGRSKSEAYMDLLTDGWLAAQPNARHCQTPDCSYQYLYEKDREDCFQEETCPCCKETRCADCCISHDVDVTCVQARSGEVSFALKQWMYHHVRLCPNCGVAVEKDGGCELVHCVECGTFFCFNCLEVDSQHHYCLLPTAPGQEELARGMEQEGQPAYFGELAERRQERMIRADLGHIGACYGAAGVLAGGCVAFPFAILSRRHPFVALGAFSPVVLGCLLFRATEAVDIFLRNHPRVDFVASGGIYSVCLVGGRIFSDSLVEVMNYFVDYFKN